MGKEIKFLPGVLLLFLACVSVFAGSSQVQAASYVKKTPVVVIDPGHGGVESGSYAVHNGVKYKEEVINWKIARYALAELQKYTDIEVHFTKRYTQSMSITERVRVAEEYGADLFVSMHVNDAGVSRPRGASVLISRGTYRPYLAAQEKLFGSYVLSELGKLGISRRFPETGGMEYRLSENGSEYPNGKKRDYYGIVAGSVEADIPGVIIEHAFISNASDASKYLRTNTQLKRLGQADARAIIRFCRQLPKEMIAVADDGKPINGWYTENEKDYYYKNGILQKSQFIEEEDETYYVNANGERLYGWQTIGRRKYYFEQNGKMCRRWKRIGKNVYYFHSTKGYMYKNKKVSTSKGIIYYFDQNGVRLQGKMKNIRESGKINTYYFQKNGTARKGWCKINNKWYCFNRKTGVMYKNRRVKNVSGKIYIFNSKGVCTNKK